MQRPDGRTAGALRPVKLITDFTMYAEGSVLVEMGNTRVICTASVEDKVPPFLEGKGLGWVTAEYAMLPRATNTRKKRDIKSLKLDGRSSEIQRLIGRSLRAAMDLKALGERTLTIDCDVIQADGGTRTAAITGGFVAAALAVDKLVERELIVTPPMRHIVAAISAGIVQGEMMVDLCYAEDSIADADINIVMDDTGALIEVQGTAEHAPYTRQQLESILDMAQDAILKEIMEKQKEALGEAWARISRSMAL